MAGSTPGRIDPPNCVTHWVLLSPVSPSALGRQVAIELIAIGQSIQMTIEESLAPGELAMLRHLLAQVTSASRVAVEQAL